MKTICMLAVYYAGTMQVNGTTDTADQQTSFLIVDKMCGCEMTKKTTCASFIDAQ